LFGVLKQRLEGNDISDGEQLKSEILRIFQGIPSGKLKKSFDHWIERCQRVAANAKTCQVFHRSVVRPVLTIITP
jgi:hypothetical protein